jgi:hypothetical protein
VIVKLIFEPHESLPPALYAQVKRAVAHSLEQYGLGAAVSEDRTSELEAYQRYWRWQREMLDGEWPAKPADAEVK